jgi:hypothetical protein
MAERKGMRRSPSRSKRRSRSIGFFATVATRPAGTGMPDFLASARATASHATVLISSSLRGNFAIARCPPFSMTDAFGGAPPSEEPSANSRSKSSSVSLSSMTCSAAKESRQFDQGWDALDARLPHERSALVLGEAQRALARLIFLAFRRTAKKGTMPIHHWHEALNYFTILWSEPMPALERIPQQTRSSLLQGWVGEEELPPSPPPHPQKQNLVDVSRRPRPVREGAAAGAGGQLRRRRNWEWRNWLSHSGLRGRRRGTRVLFCRRRRRRCRSCRRD